jgi:hypothetical protein
MQIYYLQQKWKLNISEPEPYYVCSKELSNIYLLKIMILLCPVEYKLPQIKIGLWNKSLFLIVYRFIDKTWVKKELSLDNTGAGTFFSLSILVKFLQFWTWCQRKQYHKNITPSPTL